MAATAVHAWKNSWWPNVRGHGLGHLSAYSTPPMEYSAPPTISSATAGTPAPCVIGPMNHAATQPSRMYSGTPNQRGADGRNILSSTPAIAPPQTIQNSSQPCCCGNASSANGV